MKSIIGQLLEAGQPCFPKLSAGCLATFPSIFSVLTSADIFHHFLTVCSLFQDLSFVDIDIASFSKKPRFFKNDIWRENLAHCSQTLGGLFLVVRLHPFTCLIRSLCFWCPCYCRIIQLNYSSYCI